MGFDEMKISKKIMFFLCTSIVAIYHLFMTYDKTVQLKYHQGNHISVEKMLLISNNILRVLVDVCPLGSTGRRDVEMRILSKYSPSFDESQRVHALTWIDWLRYNTRRSI